MTGINSPPASWKGRHLKHAELEWFDFDPSSLADSFGVMLRRNAI